MDLKRPFSIITPTLDGDVLALLAAGEVKLTGRAIGRNIGASQEGVRQVLERLVGQGIILREPAGNAHLYRLNRDHLAAPWIERLSSLRLEFIDRLRQRIETWRIHPSAAVLFGSVARGNSDRESDIDILVIRPAKTHPDDSEWRRQLTELESAATALTGNDARILEYSDDEVRRLRGAERVLVAAAEEGIELYGSLRPLHSRGTKRSSR